MIYRKLVLKFTYLLFLLNSCGTETGNPVGVGGDDDAIYANASTLINASYDENIQGAQEDNSTEEQVSTTFASLPEDTPHIVQPKQTTCEEKSDGSAVYTVKQAESSVNGQKMVGRYLRSRNLMWKRNDSLTYASQGHVIRCRDNAIDLDSLKQATDGLERTRTTDNSYVFQTTWKSDARSFTVETKRNVKGTRKRKWAVLAVDTSHSQLQRTTEFDTVHTSSYSDSSGASNTVEVTTQGKITMTGRFQNDQPKQYWLEKTLNGETTNTSGKQTLTLTFKDVKWSKSSKTDEATCLPSSGKIQGTYSNGERTIGYNVTFTGGHLATITYDNGKTEALLPEQCMN